MPWRRPWAVLPRARRTAQRGGEPLACASCHEPFERWLRSPAEALGEHGKNPAPGGVFCLVLAPPARLLFLGRGVWYRKRAMRCWISLAGVCFAAGRGLPRPGARWAREPSAPPAERLQDRGVSEPPPPRLDRGEYWENK